MNGQDFLRIVDEAFTPFLKKLDFAMSKAEISGRFYKVDFTELQHLVSVSFEPGDDAFFFLIFSRDRGEISNIDDRLRTPRLSDLNSRYMNSISRDERSENEAAFGSIIARDETEEVLVKAAKELRLVLPRHIASESR